MGSFSLIVLLPFAFGQMGWEALKEWIQNVTFDQAVASGFDWLEQFLDGVEQSNVIQNIPQYWDQISGYFSSLF